MPYQSSGKYTPQELKDAQAAQVAHALNIRAAYPNNPKMDELAEKIMQQDPADLLDLVEERKNPIVF